MENKTGLAENRKAFSIIKWTMRKYLPFSIAYWILMFLAFSGVEIVAMIVTTSTSKFSEYVEEIAECVEYIPSTGFAVIAILYSTIISIMAFSYMHKKRSVDFFGSMPVSRRALFFARYLAVTALCILPILLLGLLGAVISCSMEAFLISLKIIGILVVSIIGNVSFIALISVCCGTVADVIVSYGVINIVYPVCIFICTVFPTHILPGLTKGYARTTIFTLICPVAAPFAAFFGTGLAFHLYWWIALSVVLVAVCYVLCKKRKAETAQNAFAFSVVEVVIKFVTCFTVGFGLGWLMAYVGAATNSVKAEYIWFVIGLIMGIMIANILLHLIFHRGFSKYIKSLKECAVVFVTGMLFLLMVTSGAFGYDTRIPKRNDVKKISVKTDFYQKFIVDGKDLLMYTTEDGQMIEDVIDVHSQIIENAEKKKHKGLYPIVTTDYEDYSYSYVENTSLFSIQIRYTMDDGRTIDRSYSSLYGKIKVPETVDKMNIDEVSIMNAIPAKYLYGINVNRYGETESANDIYWLEKGNVNYREEDVNKLLDAVKRDIEENGIIEDISEDDYKGYEITFEYRTKNPGDKYYDYDDDKYASASIYVPESYTNTMKALEETGYGNIQLQQLMTLYGLYDSSKDFEYTKTGKEIYFKLPDTWDKDMEVRCVPYSDTVEEILTNVADDITKCEKVSDDVYKYIIPEVEDYEFTRVMFYQYSKWDFNATGTIPVSKGEENVLTTWDYKEGDLMTDLPWCEYQWSK